MSVSGGFFTNADNEQIKLSAVIAVEPLVGSNGGSYYEIIMMGGYHITVLESHYSRSDFLVAWYAA